MRLLVTLLLVLLTGCASVTPIPTDYKGQDSGSVAIGIGTLAGGRYVSYSLLFRKAGSPADKPTEVGSFTYRASGLFGGEKSDYEGNGEYGVVVLGGLPEGDYVLHNFSVFQNDGMYQARYSSRIPVAIPFKVERGTLAYLGNYQASAITGKNLLRMSVSAGAYFTVEDRSASQVPIAQRKGAGTNLRVVNFTPSPDALHNPFFVSPAERDRLVKSAAE